MELISRNYTKDFGISNDYFKIRDFLLKLGDCEFVYARWDWMITHTHLEVENLDKIKIWENQNEIVALVIFDTVLGTGYCLTLPEYTYLKREMLIYAEEHLKKDNHFNIVIPNGDDEFQKIAQDLGYIVADDSEHDAIIYADSNNFEYTLPEGLRITSMADGYNSYEYRKILWKGFNHEVNGEGRLVYTDADTKRVDLEMKRPNVDLSLKLAVINQEGEFVAYCGMWFDSKADFALIEPLATIPEYRNKGLGKALVYEGIKRVIQQGAKKVLVGSCNQFYYKIGMLPYKESAIWEKKSI